MDSGIGAGIKNNNKLKAKVLITEEKGRAGFGPPFNHDTGN